MKRIITNPIDYEAPRVSPNFIWNALFTINLVLLIVTIFFMPLFFIGVLFFFFLAPVNFISALIALYTQVKRQEECRYTLAYIGLCFLYVFIMFGGSSFGFAVPFMILSFATAVPLLLSGFLVYIMYRMKKTFGVNKFY
ncbi:MAG: hypothetical protein HRT74_02780 [Flavobacteriales bacterium]|nr:hypothetical protein [Flavobacteriales bacterium]